MFAIRLPLHIPLPQITGPLIRIIGDRFPWQIKAAILKTLGLLIRCAHAAPACCVGVACYGRSKHWAEDRSSMKGYEPTCCEIETLGLLVMCWPAGLDACFGFPGFGTPS